MGNLHQRVYGSIQEKCFVEFDYQDDLPAGDIICPDGLNSGCSDINIKVIPVCPFGTCAAVVQGPNAPFVISFGHIAQFFGGQVCCANFSYTVMAGDDLMFIFGAVRIAANLQLVQQPFLRGETAAIVCRVDGSSPS